VLGKNYEEKRMAGELIIPPWSSHDSEGIDHNSTHLETTVMILSVKGRAIFPFAAHLSPTNCFLDKKSNCFLL
jgi:hypothetical protein